MPSIQTNAFIRKTLIATVIKLMKQLDFLATLPLDEEYKSNFLRNMAKLKGVLLNRSINESEELNIVRSIQKALIHTDLANYLKTKKGVTGDVMHYVEVLGMTLSKLYPAKNDTDVITAEAIEDIAHQHLIQLTYGYHLHAPSLCKHSFTLHEAIDSKNQIIQAEQERLDRLRMELKELNESFEALGRSREYQRLHPNHNFHTQEWDTDYDTVRARYNELEEKVTTIQTNLAHKKSDLEKMGDIDLPYDNITLQGAFTPRDVIAMLAITKKFHEEFYEQKDSFQRELGIFRFSGHLKSLDAKKILLYHQTLENNLAYSFYDIRHHSTDQLIGLSKRLPIDLQTFESIKENTDPAINAIPTWFPNESIILINAQGKQLRKLRKKNQDFANANGKAFLRHLPFINFSEMEYNNQSVVLENLVQQGVMNIAQRFSCSAEEREMIHQNCHHLNSHFDQVFQDTLESMEFSTDQISIYSSVYDNLVKQFKSHLLQKPVSTSVPWDTIKESCIQYLQAVNGDLEQFKEYIKINLLSAFYQEGFLTTELVFPELELSFHQDYESPYTDSNTFFDEASHDFRDARHTEYNLGSFGNDSSNNYWNDDYPSSARASRQSRPVVVHPYSQNDYYDAHGSNTDNHVTWNAEEEHYTRARPYNRRR